MNRNKKTKNVKQNKAIDSITEMTNDMSSAKSYNNASKSKNK